MKSLINNSYYKYLPLNKALDLPFIWPQRVCIMIAITSSLVKSLIDLISMHIHWPSQLVIMILVITDYLCIAAAYHWLAHLSAAGHACEARLKIVAYRMYGVAAILSCVTVPGFLLHDWRLPLEVSELPPTNSLISAHQSASIVRVSVVVTSACSLLGKFFSRYIRPASHCRPSNLCFSMSRRISLHNPQYQFCSMIHGVNAKCLGIMNRDDFSTLHFTISPQIDGQILPSQILP